MICCTITGFDTLPDGKLSIYFIIAIQNKFSIKGKEIKKGNLNNYL